ncbi:MAG: cytochrome c, partial [Rhodobacteraceae bacterium]|nr:cytochrome c [Paracoccaceae bacterium]
FGTFVAPNISPSDQGIGGWSSGDLANALIAGVGTGGQHLYPALPYTTYQRMSLQDVADLKAFMDTLPASDAASLPHELGFPFTIRRGLGLWKRLNMSPGWVLDAGGDAELERGRYLVEALGHCAECHTPRDLTGGLDRSRWMQGAPNPSGKGTIPALTPDKLKWSAADIAYYLETGFTPDYDSAGGEMVAVIANLAHLSKADREAIAAYVKALP